MYRIEKHDVGSWLVVNSDTGETVTHYPTKVGAMNWINSQNKKTNSMSKKSNDIGFAVKSKYFSVYEAYKKELEKIGYEWNHKFNPFFESVTKDRTCIYVGTGWQGYDSAPMMSFSNPGGGTRVYNLDSEFEAAVSYAKSEYDRQTRPVEKVILNRDYVVEVYHDRIVVCGETFYQPEVTALFRAAKNAGLV